MPSTGLTVPWKICTIVTFNFYSEWNWVKCFIVFFFFMVSVNKSLNCHLEGDEDEDEEDEEDEGEDEEEPGLDYLQKENLEVNVCGWM